MTFVYRTLIDLFSMDASSLHAFAHALSSVLQSIRKTVATLTESSSKDGSIADIHTLSMWSMACEDVETVLQYLACLCGRVSGATGNYGQTHS